VHIFFLALFEEELHKFWISLTLAGYPVIWPYRISAGQSGTGTGIRPVTGYRKRQDYPAGYPVHPYWRSLQGTRYRYLVTSKELLLEKFTTGPYRYDFTTTGIIFLTGSSIHCIRLLKYTYRYTLFHHDEYVVFVSVGTTQ
jgi:hypothetical protein